MNEHMQEGSSGHIKRCRSFFLRSCLKQSCSVFPAIERSGSTWPSRCFLDSEVHPVSSCSMLATHAPEELEASFSSFSSPQFETFEKASACARRGLPSPNRTRPKAGDARRSCVSIFRSSVYPFDRNRSVSDRRYTAGAEEILSGGRISSSCARLLQTHAFLERTHLEIRLLDKNAKVKNDFRLAPRFFGRSKVTNIKDFSGFSPRHHRSKFERKDATPLSS
ncbi:hypothetical protein TGRUB_258105 [Toxoplasma gondii RUB]|uniref:Uncharacterized protein n=1 Tax=Toxoplasma gondii RUB TaxID=935652 RepID=A0A086M867_TOXGO|nr:hypothetical protein TGRUB_258105 [Toxoplasma gondii RUB]